MSPSAITDHVHTTVSHAFIIEELIIKVGVVTIVDKNARTESFTNNPWQRAKGRPKEKK